MRCAGAAAAAVCLLASLALPAAAFAPAPTRPQPRAHRPASLPRRRAPRPFTVALGSAEEEGDEDAVEPADKESMAMDAPDEAAVMMRMLGVNGLTVALGVAAGAVLLANQVLGPGWAAGGGGSGAFDPPPAARDLDERTLSDGERRAIDAFVEQRRAGFEF